MEQRTLFQRLGGTAGINAIVEDIVGAHMRNPIIRARFEPYLDTPEKLAVTKQHLCAFLETGSGGAPCYTGRSMRDAHRGMNINATEYVAALDDILSVLATHGIDDATRNEVLAIAYSLKGEIVHV